MLSLALTAFFMTCGIAALLSLADSALKLRHAWDVCRRELAKQHAAPAPLNDFAVVVLRPVPGAARRAVCATRLVAAA